VKTNTANYQVTAALPKNEILILC